jgi:hypothetical protein
MTSEVKDEPDPTPWWVGRTSGSYDPMHPNNVEARKCDHQVKGIDWEEIILSIQEDVEAGQCSYTSEQYSSRIVADIGLAVWLESIVGDMEREPPYLYIMPRVKSDIRECLTFADRRRWGKPRERKPDIRRSIENILGHPEANPIGAWRSGLDFYLRRYNGGPFVIVYEYLHSCLRFPYGAVRIRAIRYSHVANVLSATKRLTAQVS